MLKIKVGLILWLIPCFAGWEPRGQYNYAHPNSNHYFVQGSFFFFFRKTANLCFGGGSSICLYTLRRMPITDSHMRELATEGILSLRLRLGYTWQKISTS